MPTREGPRGGRTTRTPTGLVHKKLLLREDQAAELRRIAYEQHRSESEIVREALDDLLERLAEDRPGGG